MFEEFKPSIDTHDIIDSFWVFSQNPNIEYFDVLPDGCADLIFDLKHQHILVSGVMSQRGKRMLESNTHLIGVRFKAEKFGLVSEQAPFTLKNQRIDFENVCAHDPSEMIEKLANCKDVRASVGCIEHYVMERVNMVNRQEDRLIDAITKRIRLEKGRVSIDALAKYNQISMRQLERRFKNRVGLTAKEFSSIIRFDTAKRIIGEAKDQSLLQIAYRTGYFDHAHMSHEFTRISGHSPSYFG